MTIAEAPRLVPGVRRIVDESALEILTILFRFCSVMLYRDSQLVVTAFPDGTEAHATPHDTPEYHAHAQEKTGVDNCLLYAWQHDLFHVLHGEMRDRPSVVLWALAHNQPTDTKECEVEERETQNLQLAFQMRR